MADAAQQQNSESSTQRGSKRIRQASSTTSPTTAAAASPAGAGDSMQQQQQKPSIAGEVQDLLQQAVQQLVQQGRLPQQGLPPVKVIAPAAKQLSKLPTGTLLTSSCAHALAAAARKQQQQGAGGAVGQPPAVAAAAAWGSADGLAELLAGAFNSKAAEAQLSQPLVASTAKGYLNFIGQQQQQALQQQGQQLREQPSSNNQQHKLQQQQHDGQQASQHHKAPEQQPQQQQQLRQPQVPEQHQPQVLEQQQQGGVGQARQLKVVMVPSQFIQEEFELYCRYQVGLILASSSPANIALACGWCLCSCFGVWGLGFGFRVIWLQNHPRGCQVGLIL
jgi:hypothetical protein